jgi:hypothetical protein
MFRGKKKIVDFLNFFFGGHMLTCILEGGHFFFTNL